MKREALAQELTTIFQEDVWPAYRSVGLPASQVQDAVDSFRPLTAQGFIAAYERSVNATKRTAASRRTMRSQRAKPIDSASLPDGVAGHEG